VPTHIAAGRRVRKCRVPSSPFHTKSFAPITGRALSDFRRRLLHWFGTHRRELPWRESRDPYRVWLAEVMLQQTRIAAVLPYYDRFLKRFSTMELLAAAPEREVLRLWSGLGYYQRARNLHRAAKTIVAHHGGKFPRDAAVVRDLPGIGAYTRAAVMSIAFDEPLAVLDGNVARVLARLGAVRGDLREPRVWKGLAAESQRLMDAHSPGDWNQALMELGETICVPRNPLCAKCPVRQYCRAKALELTREIPMKRIKRAGVRVTLAAAVLSDTRGKTLLLDAPGRHDDVLFSRLKQFPAIEVQADAADELRQYLRDEFGVRANSLLPLPAMRHGVTFRKVCLRPFLIAVSRLPKRRGTEAVLLDRVCKLPISSATRKIALAALHSRQNHANSEAAHRRLS
jgi:A/G-specific adenine glycosylase